MSIKNINFIDNIFIFFILLIIKKKNENINGFVLMLKTSSYVMKYMINYF